MEKITLLAPAKVNLTLDIVGKRADGYHLLETVMQSVSLFDKLTITKKTEGITLTCDDKSVPTDERNIVIKAANAFFKATGVTFGVDIFLEKKIPMQAGLGGGSADGAAALLGLNLLANTKLTLSQLSRIGETVGADIPFCIYQNTAMVKGIGEQITPLSNMPHCYFVIAKPPIGISTKEAFSVIDSEMGTPIFQEGMLECINSSSIKGVATHLFNRFEQAICPPIISQLKQAMVASGGLNAIMTGSGSAVFSVFETLSKASECKAFLQSRFTDCEIFLAEPYFTE